MIRIPLLIATLFLLTTSNVRAQGTKDDYVRSRTWDQRMRNKVFRDRVTPKWINGGPDFWYRIKTGKDQHEFVLVRPEQKLRQLAFDHELFAESLSKELGGSFDAKNLPISELSLDNEVLTIRAKGRRWRFMDGELIELPDSKETQLENGSTAELMTTLEPSGGSAEDTQIQFINETDQTAKVFWVEASGRRVEYGTIESGKSREQHTFVGHTWLITANGKPLAGFRATSGDCKAYISSDLSISVPKPRRSGRRRKNRGNDSPNGEWSAIIRDHNVFIRNKESKEEFQLTKTGDEDDRFAGPFYWSPNSEKLVVMQTEQGERHTVYIVESSPKDQLQPKLHDMNYAKPGDKRDVSRPRLFDINEQKQIEITGAELFENAWDLRRSQWTSDSKRFDFMYNARGHQVVRLIGINADTGKAEALIEEKSDTFVDYAYKLHCHYTEDASEIIWMSERDGWNHLYLFDGSGKLKNQITKGDWVVREVERIDEEARQIWFRASGPFPGQDPYFVHLGRVDFDGKNLTWLTRSDGNHRWSFDPTGKYIVDTWSRVNQAPVNELRSAMDGSLVCVLEQADMSQLVDAGWMAPEPFVAKGRDGKTDIHGVIVRPTSFDETKSYPVIEKIYAGPQGSFVPKSFGQTRGMAKLAEIGFILVQIDGMGTSNRSKAFHDVCWKNLGDGGFPDRILWLKAAAKKYPQMDLERVGIFGGSAGGQNALRAMLAHGDFYKVAAADCGCHDNRMDKIWWNELWMGWPIGPHYEEQSNVTQAHRLQGKLLLTVGELDRNVDPASTMQVVDALIKADKDFDMLVVPGAGHGVGESAYGNRRRTDFFVRHLLGVEPRH